MGKKIPIDADELKRQCVGRWPEILRALAPELTEAVDAYERGNSARSRGVPCPVHGGKDGFKLFKDADRTGGGVCNTCQAKPSGYKVLEWVNGWDFRQTLEAVAEYVGYVPQDTYRHSPTTHRHPVVEKPKLDKKEEQRKIYFLKKAWRERLPLDHPEAAPARHYFNGRGTPLEEMPWALENVAFHPNLYFEMGKNGKPITSPAILEFVYDTDGRPVTIHRIFITGDGEKAFGAESKRVMPYSGLRSMSGGYVPIAPVVNGVIGVAEGLETAMAVMMGSGLPCWTTINAVNLERIVLPETIRWVVIWGDFDRKGRGQEAASNLLHRLQDEGRQAIMLFPPNLGGEKGTDWNDILVQQGPVAIPGQDEIRREFMRISRLTT